MGIKHCDDHKAYIAGCPDCLIRSRAYQAERKKHVVFNPETHHANGHKKTQGVRSDKNWRRMKEISQNYKNKQKGL